nr:immunoglobulin light chain junction region [Macaca mulatta]
DYYCGSYRGGHIYIF